MDGKLCPYLEHELLTEGGWIAWDVLQRSSRQLRIAPHGRAVVGLDMAAVLAIGKALGVDPYLLAELIPAGEAGLVAALNERLLDD